MKRWWVGFGPRLWFPDTCYRRNKNISFLFYLIMVKPEQKKAVILHDTTKSVGFEVRSSAFKSCSKFAMESERSYLTSLVFMLLGKDNNNVHHTGGFKDQMA